MYRLIKIKNERTNYVQTYFFNNFVNTRIGQTFWNAELATFVRMIKARTINRN